MRSTTVRAIIFRIIAGRFYVAATDRREAARARELGIW
jgi:hypothetical protein